MARMRSLTELYIVSRAPDKIAAVVMSTTGATIAWIAVTAIGFISPAYESGAGQNLRAFFDYDDELWHKTFGLNFFATPYGPAAPRCPA